MKKVIKRLFIYCVILCCTITFSFSFLVDYSYAASGSIPVYNGEETSVTPATQITISTDDFIQYYNMTAGSNSYLATYFGIVQPLVLNEDATVTFYCSGTRVYSGIQTSPEVSVYTADNIAPVSENTYELKKGTYYFHIISSNHPEIVNGVTKVSRTAWAYISYKYHHTYDTVTTKATLSKNGSIIKKCSTCGAISSKTTIYYPKTIKLSSKAYTFDNKAKTPSVTIIDSNGKTVSSSNYTVSYASGRKNVGTYTVKVSFKKNYSGNKTLSFIINPKGTTIKSLTAASKALNIKWPKQSAKMASSRITGYQIQLATNKSFTKNVKNVTVKGYSKVSKKVTGLKKKTTYYVRIRSYMTVNGKTYYSPWSSIKTRKTK